MSGIPTRPNIRKMTEAPKWPGEARIFVRHHGSVVAAVWCTTTEQSHLFRITITRSCTTHDVDDSPNVFHDEDILSMIKLLSACRRFISRKQQHNA
jgi:hypothetical protein